MGVVEEDLEGENFDFDDEAGERQEEDFGGEPDDEGFEGFGGFSCADSSPCANDFDCQLFSEDDLNDAFTTDNVQCDTSLEGGGCCVLK